MSKTSVAKGIKLNSFNDLFGANASDDEIIDIPLGELYAFCKHPFKVIEDEAMTRLVESIKKRVFYHQSLSVREKRVVMRLFLVIEGRMLL